MATTTEVRELHVARSGNTHIVSTDLECLKKRVATHPEVEHMPIFRVWEDCSIVVQATDHNPEAKHEPPVSATTELLQVYGPYFLAGKTLGQIISAQKKRGVEITVLREPTQSRRQKSTAASAT